MSKEAATWSARQTNVEVRESELDGVRVLHFPDDSGRAEATLIFGVGARDETLPTLGTLHALEHAAMTGVRRTPIEIDATVRVSTTQFTAAGSPHLVGSFLTGVCRGLADPPLDRLAHEAQILEAELEGDDSATSPAAVFRYGFRDLGILDGPGPSPSRVRADAVRDAAARWFVASNALLVVEGSWPDGLRLPLVNGVRPDHPAVLTRHVGRPSAITVEAPCCEVNVVMPADPAATRLALTVVEDRLTEVLRHQRGLIYDVDIDAIPIREGFDVTIRTDPQPERVRDGIRAMVQTITTLLADGPTEAELEHARAIVRESMQGRDAEIGDLVDTATADLIGLPSPRIHPDLLDGFNRGQVAEHLNRIATDLIYIVDEAIEGDLPTLGLDLIEPEPTTNSPLPAGQAFRPPLLALALAKEARASRVALTATGLAHTYQGRLQQIAWPDVVGVMRDDDGDLIVFAQDGQVIPVGPTLYKNGQRLVDAVLTHVAGHLVYEAPADSDTDDHKEANSNSN
ncbi:MAG TPA: insulinase family protein [Microlunatus sp.]